MSQLIYKFYIIWFLVGLVLVSLDLIPPWLEWANSVFLILAGFVALLYAVKAFGKKRGILLSIAIAISTFVIEGVSAHYDIFFGNYDYTDRFPPLLFGVPIGIGFAWLVMIMAGHALTRNIPNRIWRMMIAALFVVGLDLVLDPVAYVDKGYWLWQSESSYYGIPWTNFAGWFFIAFVWQGILLCFKSKPTPELAKQIQVVFWTIVLLFTVLAFVAGLYKAIIVTAIVLVVVESLRRWSNEKA